MKETIKEKGNATYGLSEIEQALSYGAVDTLILSEELGLNEIERLGELADQTNSKVEVLSNKTESGNILYEAFGGIVCLLRFRHQRLN